MGGDAKYRSLGLGNRSESSIGQDAPAELFLWNHFASLVWAITGTDDGFDK
jgi:hypothetical protein